MPKPISIYLQYALPKVFLTRVAGAFANAHCGWLTRLAIKYFIKWYNVEMSEAEQSDYRQFTTFNQFFTRRLKQQARIIDNDPASLVSPVDGTVAQLGSIDNDTLIQAKGRDYSLTALLGGCPERAKAFVDGGFATLYLSPKDYHRVHAPIKCQLIESIYVPGELFSVNETTSQQVPNLFARNERLVCLFNSDEYPFFLVFVGATIVGSIHTSWAGRINPNRWRHPVRWQHDDTATHHFNKGDELGAFELGSTVIIGTPQHVIDAFLLEAGDSIQLGQTLGRLASGTEHTSNTSTEPTPEQSALGQTDRGL